MSSLRNHENILIKYPGLIKSKSSYPVNTGDNIILISIMYVAQATAIKETML